MKCDLPVELLSAYLDGELDREHTNMVEEHLKACAICRKELETLRQLDTHVRNMHIEEPSRDFVFTMNRRVMDRIQRRRKFPWFRLSPVLVPVAVAALIVIVLMRSSEPVRLVSLDDRVLYEVKEKDTYFKTAIPETGGSSTVVRDKEVVSDGESEEYSADAVVSKKAEVPVVTKSGREINEEKTAVTAPPPVPEYTEKKSTETSWKGGVETVSGMATEDEVVQQIVNEELQARNEQVVRAIIDTNGRIVNVALGNTIMPEYDSLLEDRLKGKQLTPATVKGRRMQIYVDFTQEEPAAECPTK
jgi:hypothetical protein